MKKKLLVLSASAILASNFVFDNNASAVVSENDYKSDALSLRGDIRPEISLDDYLDNLKNLMVWLTVGNFSGYDEPEYEEVFQKYQKRFLAELDAVIKCVIEDDRNYKYIRKYDTDNIKEKIGLTHQRYERIFDNLENNRINFDADVRKIENKYKDLKRFDEKRQLEAEDEVYDLEHKALLVGKAFSEHEEARINLNNKLSIIMAYTKDKNKIKMPTNVPTNQRMLNEIKEDLETVIDEFFEEIGLARPKNIPILTNDNKNDLQTINKIKEDAEAAKYNSRLVDPGVAERKQRAEESLAKLTKKSKEAQELAAKTKAAIKVLKARKGQTEFSYKKLRQTQTKELAIEFPDNNPKLPTYTESTQIQKQPVLKQQVKEEKVDVLKSKRPESTLKGMTGESNLVTMDTHSNASTLRGSNNQVYEFSFESSPQMTNVAQPQIKEAVAAPTNNLAGLSGESNALNFTYDSQPVNNDTFTESNEIVLDQHTDIKVSGFTTGESIEDSHVSNEVTK
ncbi:hypothetical protein BU589_08745 [Staphylococcus agnetis]|uniref:coagulase domain-containing protein n=1 Tax=Staphylococcus agnetis TaxID=985762 RepID=UPI000D1ACCCB|nr:coagulase domain-containing protein [Staphylococcus agnetis]PTH31760.1 hypothetical protein BU589_08745 [Staphylococcus agnetis]